MRINICENCGVRFESPKRPRRWCGSIKEKTGCVYLRQLDQGRGKDQRKTQKMRESGEKVDWRKSTYACHLDELLEMADYKCSFCKCQESLTIDHIKPRMIGGSDDIDNLRILYRSCNTERHQRLVKHALKFYFDNGFFE